MRIFVVSFDMTDRGVEILSAFSDRQNALDFALNQIRQRIPITEHQIIEEHFDGFIYSNHGLNYYADVTELEVL